MNLFKNEEEIEKIKIEREALITSLSNFKIDSDEKRFLIRRINIISEKLLEKSMYTGKLKE